MEPLLVALPRVSTLMLHPALTSLLFPTLDLIKKNRYLRKSLKLHKARDDGQFWHFVPEWSEEHVAICMYAARSLPSSISMVTSCCIVDLRQTIWTKLRSHYKLHAIITHVLLRTHNKMSRIWRSTLSRKT